MEERKDQALKGEVPPFSVNSIQMQRPTLFQLKLTYIISEPIHLYTTCTYMYMS